MTPTYYVMHGYTIKEFNSYKDALDYIQEYLDEQNLHYYKVYDHEDESKELRVLIYQYYTLYTEVFTISKELKLY